MTTALLTPAMPRVRTAYSARDGGSCSTEYVFDSDRVLLLADQFNRLTAEEQAQFGSPSADQQNTGKTLFVRFVAYCREHGVGVENDSCCIHYTRGIHPDLIRTFTYNEMFPITTIDLTNG